MARKNSRSCRWLSHATLAQHSACSAQQARSKEDEAAGFWYRARSSCECIFGEANKPTVFCEDQVTGSVCEAGFGDDPVDRYSTTRRTYRSSEAGEASGGEVQNIGSHCDRKDASGSCGAEGVERDLAGGGAEEGGEVLSRANYRVLVVHGRNANRESADSARYGECSWAGKHDIAID